MFEGHCFTVGHAAPVRPCSDHGSTDLPTLLRDAASAGTTAARDTHQMLAGALRSAGSSTEPAD
jgi:hypothetical protein